MAPAKFEPEEAERIKALRPTHIAGLLASSTLLARFHRINRRDFDMLLLGARNGGGTRPSRRPAGKRHVARLIGLTSPAGSPGPNAPKLWRVPPSDERKPAMSEGKKPVAIEYRWAREV